MRRTLLQILYTLFIFVISVVAFEHLFYQEESLEITEMEQAVLPVINMRTGSISFNVLYGYTDEIEPGSMDPGLTPYGEDRVLSFVIPTGEQDLEGLSYEVRSPGGERLIEAGDLPLSERDEQTGEHRIRLSDLLEAGQTYMLTLKAELRNGMMASYYTWTAADETGGQYAEGLSFVKDFHSRTIAGAQDSWFMTYLEPDVTATSANLSHVTIHSQVSDVTFGTLSLTEPAEAVFSLRDVQGQDYVYACSCLLEEQTEWGTARYLCEEMYRVRKGTSRFHLMDYDRTLTRVPDPEHEPYPDGQIPLGISAEENSVAQSPDGTKVAYTAAGNLYLADAASDVCVWIFGFAREGGADVRDWHNEHRVKILSVSDEGDVDFLVCGYMNRGGHEGKTGVLIYRYSGSERTLEEEVFLRSRQGYAMIAEEVEHASFRSDNGKVYLLMEDDLLEVDPADGTFRTIEEVLSDSSCVVSPGGRRIARLETGENGEPALAVTDLRDRSKRYLTPGNGEILSPLGFVGDDLVYGVSFPQDEAPGSAGDRILPMRALWVVDEFLNPVGGYEQEGIYLHSCEIEEGQITIQRLQKQTAENGSTFYAALPEEHLSMSTYEPEGSALVTRGSQAGIGPVKTIQTPGLSGSQLRFARPRRIANDNRILTLYKGEAPERYLVYTDGAFRRSYPDLINAAEHLGSSFGCIRDECGILVYRSTEKDRAEISVPASVGDQAEGLAACLGVILALEGTGGDVKTAMEERSDPVSLLEALTGCRAFDLTELSMEEMLCFPARGLPLLLQTGYGSGNFLILGYGPEKIALYNAQTHAVELPERSQVANWLSQPGTRVCGYYRSVKRDAE